MIRKLWRAGLVGSLGYALVAAVPGVATAPAQRVGEKAGNKVGFVAHEALSVGAARVELVRAAVKRDGESAKVAAVVWLDAEAAKHFDVPMGEKLKAALVLPVGREEKVEEAAELVMLNPGRQAGSPIYFINGVATTRERAEEEAEELSDQVKRPVWLLYNPTAMPSGDKAEWQRNAGVAIDLAEAVNERAWPLMKGGLVPDAPTRQMTWVLTHAAGPVTIVSHSQGCLIVRNALLMAARLEGDGGAKVAARVTWVATGLPLRDEEIVPRPAGLAVIAHAGDPVSQSIGMRLDPAEFTRQKMAAHFFSGYVGEVDLEGK